MKFTAEVGHGELTIKLARAQSRVKVTISRAELAVSRQLEHQVAHRHVKSLSILLQATNSDNATTTAIPRLSV